MKFLIYGFLRLLEYGILIPLFTVCAAIVTFSLYLVVQIDKKLVKYKFPLLKRLRTKLFSNKESKDLSQ